MKVAEFIKWLETKPQHLEVAIVEASVEIERGAFGEEEVLVIQSVCFDDPQIQSKETKSTLILGVE